MSSQNGFIKIGELARLAGVSVRVLRHYDQVGLLAPTYSDPETGYRYYAFEQLPQLARIQAFRQMGLSLVDIALLLDTQTDLELKASTLYAKKRTLEGSIANQQAQVRLLERRLASLEQTGHSPRFEVIQRMRPAQQVLVTTWPLDEVDRSGGVHGNLQRILTTLEQRNIRVRDIQGLFHHHFCDRPYSELRTQGELNPQGAFECAISLESMNFESLELADGQVLHTKWLPVQETASILIAGSYWQKFAAHQLFSRWGHTNGYVLAGPIIDHYIHVVNQDLAHPGNLLELHFPIARARY
ncbi:MAG: helix-turn-helix domain-containing protein [Deinococcota bacterium]